MTALDYDNATFNVDEYLELYPDLVAYWDGHASTEEPQWGGDIRYWAASHWQTHGSKEGRQGRASTWIPPITVQAEVIAANAVLPLPNSAAVAAATAAASAANAEKKTPWLLYAGLAVGAYLYATRSNR